MNTKAQCKLHREVILKLHAARVQMGQGSHADLVMVVEPCHKCIFEAKKSALIFAYNDLQTQALRSLDKMEESL